MSKASVTQRAAEAIKNRESSVELASIQVEIVERIQAVERELKLQESEVEKAMDAGDLDALRFARQSETDLRDEDKVLHRKQSDLAQAIRTAKGEEAVKAAAEHSGNLVRALNQAEKAQAMLKESREMVHHVYLARQHANRIGQSLVFDADTIRALAAAMHPEGSERKQLMLNLGIREAMKAA